jgi:hypothetical protein
VRTGRCRRRSRPGIVCTEDRGNHERTAIRPGPRPAAQDARTARSRARRPRHVRSPAVADGARAARLVAAGRGDRRCAVRRLDHQPARSAVRASGHPGQRLHAGHVSPRPRHRDLRLARGRRLRRRPLPTRADRGRARQHQGARRRGGRSRDRAGHRGRRPLDHLAGGDRGGRGAGVGQRRHRPLRRPRGHRGHHRRQPGQPRHPHAPPDRVRRGARPQLRAGRPAWLLATGGRLRLDAVPGHALAPHAGDLGPRHAGRDRGRGRRGARRRRAPVRLRRHRRPRSRLRARHGHARAGRHGTPRPSTDRPTPGDGREPRGARRGRGVAAV